MKDTIKEYLLKGEKEKGFLISDVANHGCSGGTISELIYYNDINKFYDKHHEASLEAVAEAVAEAASEVKAFHPTDDISAQSQGGKGHTSDGSEVKLP